MFSSFESADVAAELSDLRREVSALRLAVKSRDGYVRTGGGLWVSVEDLLEMSHGR